MRNAALLGRIEDLEADLKIAEIDLNHAREERDQAKAALNLERAAVERASVPVAHIRDSALLAGDGLIGRERGSLVADQRDPDELGDVRECVLAVAKRLEERADASRTPNGRKVLEVIAQAERVERLREYLGYIADDEEHDAQVLLEELLGTAR